MQRINRWTEPVFTICNKTDNFSKISKEFIISKLDSAVHKDTCKEIREGKLKSMKVKEANSLLSVLWHPAVVAEWVHC